MQVFLMASDGTAEMIGVFPAQPKYKELEKLVSEVCSITTFPCPLPM